MNSQVESFFYIKRSDDFTKVRDEKNNFIKTPWFFTPFTSGKQ